MRFYRDHKGRKKLARNKSQKCCNRMDLKWKRETCGKYLMVCVECGAAHDGKPYAPPVITRYGTLRDITKASAVSGALDGNTAFSLKTGASV